MPVVTTELEFGSAFQLLCATLLSAQCTDKRINQVTPALFARFPDAKSMAKADPEDVFEYITSLRRGDDKVVLLSNAGFPFMGDIIDRFDFKSHFDKIFVSGAYHIMKPDPEFYKLAINSYSEKFDHIYMIDDNPKNLAPVSALGIEPILYTDLPSLKAIFH